MDNLTHSLTGILADRVLPDRTAASAGPPGSPAARKLHRPVFWLFLLSANTPDIDVVANLFTDPLTSLGIHRGITHSFYFAPFLALLPAAVVYAVSLRRDFIRLWIFAFAGVCVHIFTDLITAYGTQIFYPFSGVRHSLDWMFIIDPWFTGMLLLLLIAGKFIPRWKRVLGFVTLGLTVLYLGAEYRMNAMALERFRNDLEREGRATLAIAALPQPLNLTSWVGLAMTDSGAIRQYISILEPDSSTGVEYFPIPDDPWVKKAFRTEHVGEYLRFARFPVVTSGPEGDFHAVEFRDLQFSVDPRIARAVGLGERDIPFVLKILFDRSGLLIGVEFNGKPVPLVR